MHALLDDYVEQVWRQADLRNDEDTAPGADRLEETWVVERDVARHIVATSNRTLAAPEPPRRRPSCLSPWLTSSIAKTKSRSNSSPRWASMTPERSCGRLERVADAAEAAARHESKLRRLVRFILRVREPLIVFTEYRDTLVRLADALTPLATLTTLHGGLDRAARAEAERGFTSGAARVLIATDAAGEGLNLQARCRLVVSYELPWNPMRLEQRIGRVDRIGQRQRVHALHLVAGGTAEASLLARLVDRLEKVRASVGHTGQTISGAPERAVASAMLGQSAPARVLKTSFGPHTTTPSNARRSRFRLSSIRRVRVTSGPWRSANSAGCPRLRDLIRNQSAHGEGTRFPTAILAHLDRNAPLVTFGRATRRRGRRSGARGLVCLFRARILDGSGGLVETVLVAIRAALTGLPPGHTRSVARLASERLLHPVDSRIRHAAKRCVELRLAATLPRYDAACARPRVPRSHARVDAPR